MGLIPAHAGSTAELVSQPWWLRGSSPLTRGALNVALLNRDTVRLIPAHAGSTPIARSSIRGCSAHPRSRGEHLVGERMCTPREGSSPLTRGARLNLQGHGLRLGLIPAHAGSTTPTRCCAVPPGAHPRSRGEHRSRPGFVLGLPGSSPLTRGAQPGGHEHKLCGGLIPAHAGSTLRLGRRR